MDENETIFTNFVIEKLENAGGCMKFQHITGHLSQLDESVRRAVGTKPTELMRFLRNRPHLFTLELNNSMVGLVKSGNNPSFQKGTSDFEKNGFNSSSESGFPKTLKDHKGIVIKVLPNFGFIASKAPKASVYFVPANFEDSNKRLLTDLVEPGQKVCFNARIGDAKFESKYQATKVWISKDTENEVRHPDGFSKNRKTRDSGKYDGNVSEGSGKVQKVFDSYGFIIINNDPQNTVYFTKKNVCNVENILDLSKVIKVHDEVEYKAVRSTNSKTRWQASKVWLKSHGKSHRSKEEVSLNNQSKKEVGLNTQSRERKISEPGKIYPSGNGVVIKFGVKFEYLADADSCHFYMHEIKVQDVCWEFSDGDHVMFDAIKIKSVPGWKALLCWVGQRPDLVLPVDLGDFSEFPDEDVDDIPDTGSVASKISGTSTVSEVSRNSSGASKIVKSFLSSKAQKHRDTYSSSNHRNSRDNNRSDFQNTSSRSLSRSSRSSQHSNQNFQKKKPHNANRSRDKSSTNFPQSHSRFENDSGFESYQSTPREPNNSYYDKEVRPHHGNNLKDEYAEFESLTKYSKATIKSDKKSGKPKSETYSNWGDSPYPDEENASDSDVVDTLSETYDETSKNPSDDEKSSHSKCDSNEKYEEVLSNEEFDDNEAGYENAVETIDNESPSIDNKEIVEDAASESRIEGLLEETPKDDEEDEEAFVSEEPQIQPYIKRFSDLSGKVLKVYCRYAEVENEHIKKKASFFWTDLYCNGRPAPDHFDDLKEVLREGQTINFNCIEIVDDSGSCWQKVTMAWKGQKPKINEMTPDEFIFENNLVVSASEDLNEKADSSQAEEQKPAAPTRKFLALAVEDDDDEEEDEDEEADEDEATYHSSNITEPSTVEEPPVHNRQVFSSNFDLESSLPETSSPVNLVQLTEAVGKMFLSYRHSEIDVDAIASDVVHLVLSRAGVKNGPTSAEVCSSCEKESQTQAVPPSADLEHCAVSHKADLTESSVQTIITGDVIAQSIFTL